MMTDNAAFDRWVGGTAGGSRKGALMGRDFATRLLTHLGIAFVEKDDGFYDANDKLLLRSNPCGAFEVP